MEERTPQTIASEIPPCSETVHNARAPLLHTIALKLHPTKCLTNFNEIQVSCDCSHSRWPSCKLRAECFMVCYWGILKKVTRPPSSSTRWECLTRRCPLGWGRRSGGCAAPASGWTLAGTKWDVSASQSVTLSLIVRHTQEGNIWNTFCSV